MPSSAKLRHEWTGDQLRSAADFSNQQFSAQQVANLYLGDSHDNLQEIVPLKLNFSNEALAENMPLPEDLSVAQQLMGEDSGAGAMLHEFPSLRDLETSNLLTNRFMG